MGYGKGRPHDGEAVCERNIDISMTIIGTHLHSTQEINLQHGEEYSAGARSRMTSIFNMRNLNK